MNTAFFNFVKGKILAGVPAIKTVQIYRSQMDHVRNKKDEIIKAYPALFIEFIVNETRNFSYGIKNVDIVMRCRFALNHFTFERKQDLDFLDTFDGTMQMMRGGSTDPVQFSSFQEVATTHDENFDDVDEPYVDYITCWRRVSGYTRKGDLQKTNWNDQVISTIVTSLP